MDTVKEVENAQVVQEGQPEPMSILLPDTLMERLEALKVDHVKRVSALEAEMNRTIEVLLVGFLSDKEYPKDAKIQLSDNSLIFL